MKPAGVPNSNAKNAGELGLTTGLRVGCTGPNPDDSSYPMNMGKETEGKVSEGVPALASWATCIEKEVERKQGGWAASLSAVTSGNSARESSTRAPSLSQATTEVWCPGKCGESLRGLWLRSKTK